MRSGGQSLRGAVNSRARPAQPYVCYNKDTLAQCEALLPKGKTGMASSELEPGEYSNQNRAGPMLLTVVVRKAQS